MGANHLTTFLLTLTFCVCVHQHLDRVDYNQSEYLASLQDTENKFKADIDKIKQLIKGTQRSLVESASTNEQEIQKLSQNFAEERDVINRIETYFGLPFNLKACAKTFNLTNSQKDNLNAQLQKIREAIDGIKMSVNEQGDCKRMKQLQKELEYELLYVTNIQSLINSDCRKGPREYPEEFARGMVDLNRSIPVSNLDASNWIYGNTSAQQYKFEMFALASKHDITKCKLEKPFAVNLTHCVKCQGSTPIFNLGFKKCVQCPNQTYYDAERGKCKRGSPSETDKEFINSNRKSLNFVGKRPLFNINRSECPKERPFFDGESCIVCNIPLIFNFKSLACERCPEKTVYSFNLRRCIRKMRTSLSSLEQAQNWISAQKSGKVYLQWKRKTEKEDAIICPTRSPYYDGVACIPCQLPRVFNLDNLLCVSVMKGYVFDENIHKIIRKSQIQHNTRPEAPYLFIEQGVAAPKLTTNLCPKSQPYFDGMTCIDCQQPRPIFNYKLRLCTKCAHGKLFDPATRKCQVYQTRFFTNLKASNIMLTSQKTLEDYQREQKQQMANPLFPFEVCPEQVPFFTKNTCINCPSHQPYFNIEGGECENCPQGKSFIQALHRCTVNTYVTNLQAPNLLVESQQTYSKLLDKINTADSTSPDSRVVQCPDQTPYFNGQRCIRCYQAGPLFSLQNKRCVNCPKDTVYSDRMRSCKKITFETSPSAPNLLYRGNFNQYIEQFNRRRTNNPQDIVCANDKPYFDGMQCISCPAALPLFDLNKRQCLRCMKGYRYNVQAKKCLKLETRVKTSFQKTMMNLV